MNATRKKKFVLTAVLTSSKIPILALIKGYCYGKIPQKSIPPILSILVELIENDPERRAPVRRSNDTQYTDEGENEKVSDFVHSYFPSLLEIMSSIESSIRAFFKRSNISNQTFYEDDTKYITKLILDEMWSIRSYDDFYSFLTSSTILLNDNSFESTNTRHATANIEKPQKSLNSSSFLGKFVSTISLGTTSMNFEEGLQIWKGFIQYREETEKLWMSSNGIDHTSQIKSEEELFEESILASVNITNDQGSTLVYSQIDLANLFQSQVRSLEKKSTPMSKSMNELLQTLSQSSKSLLPSSYHVEHLHSWRNGEYDLSFDTLHRYFDYTMSNRRQYFYHYALLALAGVHDSYGASREALRAIDEAITVARENKDMDCLNLLLTWLMNFMINKPQLFDNAKSNPSRKETLDFLRSKTKETNNISLQAIALQYEILAALLDGPDLREVMANFTKSMYLILNFSESSELKCVLVTVCQIADTIFKRIGYPSIGDVYMDMAIDYAKELENEFDLVTLYTRKAKDDFFRGDFQNAFVLLAQVKLTAQKNFSVAAKWKMTYYSLRFYLCLNECRYPQCEVLLSNMRSLSKTLGDQEIAHELTYQESEYFIALGAKGRAFEILAAAKNKMRENQLYFNHHWDIIFGRVQAEILISVTGKLRTAVSLLLRNITIDVRHSLILNAAEDVILFCTGVLKLRYGNYITDVDRIMKEFLPRILQIGKAGVVGDAYQVMAQTAICKFLKHKRERAILRSEASTEFPNEGNSMSDEKTNTANNNQEVPVYDRLSLESLLEQGRKDVKRMTYLAYEEFKKMHDYLRMKQILVIMQDFIAGNNIHEYREELTEKFEELSSMMSREDQTGNLVGE